MSKFILTETPDHSQLVVSRPDGTEVSRFPVEQVMESFGEDMRQLLSTFDYSDRLGLPMSVTSSAQEFGAMMRQNMLYDRGRTSDDDRFDD